MKFQDQMRKLNEAVSRISYKDWSFILGEKHNVPYLQVTFRAVSSATGLMEVQFGRRWMLSAEMSPSEIVQTALMAVLAAEEHEAREAFRYLDVPVFNPHIDFHKIATGANALEAEPLTDSKLNAIEALDPWHDLV